MIEYKNDPRFSEMENAFLNEAIEAIDIAILNKCKIKLAHPENLKDALMFIGKRYSELVDAEDSEPVW